MGYRLLDRKESFAILSCFDGESDHTILLPGIASPCKCKIDTARTPADFLTSRGEPSVLGHYMRTMTNMLQPGKKISHRFLLSIIAIVLIPIGIMGYESYILAKRTLTAFAFQHMATVAENKANHLDSWLKERLGDIRVLARLPVIREACREFHEPVGKPPATARELLKDTLDLIEAHLPPMRVSTSCCWTGGFSLQPVPTLSTPRGLMRTR